MNEEIHKPLSASAAPEETIPMEAELAKAKTGTLKERMLPADEDFGEGEGQLTIDVYQTPEEIIVESPIAGVNPDELDISITSESVTVKGKRERERKVRDEDYFYQECYWGKFSRSVILPQEVDAERAEAGIKNGVLTIRLPKVSRAKSKKIKVKFD